MDTIVFESSSGRIKGYPNGVLSGPTGTSFVRCVRGSTTYGQNNFINNGDGTITDLATGELLAKSLGDKKALLHQNHGIITTGESVDEAAWWFIALERACQSQLLVMAAGEMKIIPDEYAQISYDQSGHSFGGWFQFQTIKQEFGLV